MIKWKLITNVSFADIGEVRAWCHALLIDMEPHKGFGDSIRQIRGLSYGGLPTFTVWIDPKSEVEILDAHGNVVMMSHDGNAYNLGGCIVRAKARDGKMLEIGLGIDDFRGKMVIEDIEHESCPFGEEIDRRILPHAGGGAYPSVVWMPVPKYSNKKKVEA